MIDGDEHGGLAFAGERGRQIGAPHGIEGVGDDGAVVVPGPRGEPTRPGGNRPFSRISRSTRRNDVRMPARAQTFR